MPERVLNATSCRICGANADKLESGIYVCQAVPGHMADGVVGLWRDLSYPDDMDQAVEAEATP